MRKSTTIIFTGWILWAALAAPLAADGTGSGGDAARALERLARRVVELEAENAELERELERYRSGLERAVAEIRHLRGRPEHRRAAPPATHPLGRRSALEVGDRLLSRPRTHVEGRRVTVAGEIKNPHRERLFGTLVIELLRDGMPVDEVRLPFEVPPRSQVPYSRTFELAGYAAGSYSARAGFAY